MKRICKIRLSAIVVALILTGIVWSLNARSENIDAIDGLNTAEIVAPEIEGNIKIAGKSAIEIALEEGNVVSLFKDFKMGKYPITFSFDGNDMKEDEQGRGIVLFSFETLLYQNGKLIKSLKRKPMPFFPGEMLEPVETFDIINLLTYAQGDPLKKEFPGKLEKGTYTIVLRAIPVGANGNIKESKMIVWI